MPDKDKEEGKKHCCENSQWGREGGPQVERLGSVASQQRLCRSLHCFLCVPVSGWLFVGTGCGPHDLRGRRTVALSCKKQGINVRTLLDCHRVLAWV